jgi:hypothetical protein
VRCEPSEVPTSQRIGARQSQAAHSREVPDHIWNDWIIARVLTREATDLLQPETTPDAVTK